MPSVTKTALAATEAAKLTPPVAAPFVLNVHKRESQKTILSIFSVRSFDVPKMQTGNARSALASSHKKPDFDCNRHVPTGGIWEEVQCVQALSA
jgi:hypothetical protein